MTEKRGYEVQDDAWAEFDAWLARKPDEVQDLSLLEQIDLYKDDSRPSWAQIDLLWAAIGIAWFAGLGVLVLWVLRP